MTARRPPRLLVAAAIAALLPGPWRAPCSAASAPSAAAAPLRAVVLFTGDVNGYTAPCG